MGREYISKKTKETVKSRAKPHCEYCQCPASHVPVSFTMEHIIPLSKEGKNTTDNLAFACFGCNMNKHTKTHEYDPISEQIRPLFHSREQKWEEHFKWRDDFIEILGMTSVGRASIIALKLNRANLVNLRKALIKIGIHPPKHTL